MGVVHKVKRAAAAYESQMAANMPVPVAVAAPSLTATSKYPRFGKRGAPQAFPSKLYEILEGESPDIVGWTATGRGFEVRDHARLSSEVLGRFFKQDKFSSFQRQLNLYGFRKITKGCEAGSYQHPHFRRGERTTLLTIRRSTKASPTRVVPSSPASHTPPPAVPMNTNGPINNSRSLSPTPPSMPAARGVLPWPRPATPLSALHSNSRGLSIDSANSGGGGQAVTADGRLGGTESPAGRPGNKHHPLQHNKQVAWPTEGAPSGGGGGYIESIGGHAAGAGGGWASADRAGRGSSIEWKGVEAEVNITATAANSHGNIYTAGAPRWGEGVVKREREKSPGLDHQDVEVVGLLQRMAKEAQDSPSRKQAAPSAPRWEGTTAAAEAPSYTQPQFVMPSPPAGSNAVQQGQQMHTFSDGFYGVANQERTSAVPRSSFSYAHPGAGTEGRPSAGFTHQAHVGLPSPFLAATPSSSDGSHMPRADAINPSLPATHTGGVGEVSERERQALLERSRSSSAERRDGGYTHSQHPHQHPQQQQQQQNPQSFESIPNRPVGNGGVTSLDSRFTRYNFSTSYNRQEQNGSGLRDNSSSNSNNADPEDFRHASWQGHDGQYSSSSSSAFTKYEAEESGNAGGVATDPARAEKAWAQQQHRPYQGGHRILN